jgi:hypothetical protein
VCQDAFVMPESIQESVPSATRCSAENCGVPSLPRADSCLLHASPEERRDFVVNLDATTNLSDYLSNTTIPPDVLGEIAQAFARPEPLLINNTQFIDADLRLAEFGGPLSFIDCLFVGHTRFGSTDQADLQQLGVLSLGLQGPSRARGCHFHDVVILQRVIFESSVDFSSAQFDAHVYFQGVACRDVSYFERTMFNGPVSFGTDYDGQTFTSTYLKAGKFSGASFRHQSYFYFEYSNLPDYRFSHFHGATDLVFTEVESNPSEVRNVPFILSLYSARFEGDFRIKVEPSQTGLCILDLTDTYFEQPLKLTTNQPLLLSGTTIKQQLSLAGSRVLDSVGLLSLVNATLDAPLILDENVSLLHCYMTGATGLQLLQVVGANPQWPVYHRRRIIADEVLVRRGYYAGTFDNLGSKDGRYGMFGEDRPNPDWYLDHSAHLRIDRLKCQSVESTYRQLRASLEESKAAPDAADFYYGEMEMRRSGRHTKPFDRVLLFAYWLAAGYGLRASRAAATYLSIVAVVTLMLVKAQRVFITAPKMVGNDINFHSYADVFLRVVMRSSVSFFAPVATSGFSAVGVATLLILRLVGPACLALAILALRARVQK